MGGGDGFKIWVKINPKILLSERNTYSSWYKCPLNLCSGQPSAILISLHCEEPRLFVSQFSPTRTFKGLSSIQRSTMEEDNKTYSLSICTGCQVHSYTLKEDHINLCSTCSVILSSLVQNTPIFFKNVCVWCLCVSYEKTFSFNFCCETCKTGNGCCVDCGDPVPLQHIFTDMIRCHKCNSLCCPKCGEGGLKKKWTLLKDDGSKRATFICPRDDCSGFIKMMCPNNEKCWKINSLSVNR